jgi:sugar phosphate permease
MLSMVSDGLNQFLVVGLAALHHTPLALANTALTVLLTMVAVGVLLGGVVAARTAHHNLVAGSGLLVTGLVSATIGVWDPGVLLLFALVTLSGLATGMTMPSRDMIVRSATPPGSFGKVFGFVSTGLHLGGVIAPMIFGQFLDHGRPQFVFFYIAACAMLAVVIVTFSASIRRPA